MILVKVLEILVKVLIGISSFLLTSLFIIPQVSVLFLFVYLVNCFCIKQAIEKKRFR